MEKFLRKNADSVTGRCLEFGEDRYKSYFQKITEHEIIDIVERPGIKYVCDIHDPKGISRNHFNAMICTQVFEHSACPEKAAKSLYDLMALGGILLLNSPYAVLVKLADFNHQI